MPGQLLHQQSLKRLIAKLRPKPSPTGQGDRVEIWQLCRVFPRSGYGTA
jgi:hypothetical protein